MKQSMMCHVIGVESGTIEKENKKWARVHIRAELSGEGRHGFKADVVSCDWQVAERLFGMQLPKDIEFETALESRKLASGAAGFSLRVVGFAADKKGLKAA